MTDRNQKMRDALKEIEATVTTTLAQQPEDDEKCGQFLYDALVTVHNCINCRYKGGLLDECKLKWAQMPYKDGGAK